MFARLFILFIEFLHSTASLCDNQTRNIKNISNKWFTWSMDLWENNIDNIEKG